ncbi:MAG TPA: periplasmic heavy metal sensor [Candidatus Methylomirabilis sp.]|nr:periplasmic heavy metal sensor [Candidatus Methylomirabilis sp.]
MMGELLSDMLEKALDQASVTPEQRAAIYGARDRALAVMDSQRPDPRGQRDRMLALFEGPQLTQAQLDALRQQAEQQRQAIQAAVDRAIVEVHETLTPAQRKIVADYFRAHGPDGRMRGPHGGGAFGGPPPGGPPPR